MTTCTCWDIPRSDCCYCGAYAEWERESLDFEKKVHSYFMAGWAFGWEGHA